MGTQDHPYVQRSYVKLSKFKKDNNMPRLPVTALLVVGVACSLALATPRDATRDLEKRGVFPDDFDLDNLSDYSISCQNAGLPALWYALYCRKYFPNNALFCFASYCWLDD